jgi:DNA-binding transcriptional ArsR family regulator
MLQPTFLTNHFHIIVSLPHEPYSRIPGLSDELGLTQRTAPRILTELIEDKVLKMEKEGRKNLYSINRKKRLHHTLENKHRIGELLNIPS